MTKSVLTWCLAGHDFNNAEIQEVCETVKMVPDLCRKQLAFTVSELLEWYTASGSPKWQASEKLLIKLEDQELFDSPP